MSAWPSAVIFDLDGTLVDSLPDIAGAVNELMTVRGLGLHSSAAVSRMIGKGVGNLVGAAFAAHGIALTPADLDQAIDDYLRLYEPRATRDTVLFPPVRSLLAELQQRGSRLAVCTNKPTAISVAMIRDFGLSDVFGVVVGGDYGPARKPAPDLLLKTAELIGADPADAVMVGDSSSDVLSAKAAGIKVIAVDTGYSAVPVADLGADAVISTLADFWVGIDRITGSR